MALFALGRFEMPVESLMPPSYLTRVISHESVELEEGSRTFDVASVSSSSSKRSFAQYIASSYSAFRHRGAQPAAVTVDATATPAEEPSRELMDEGIILYGRLSFELASSLISLVASLRLALGFPTLVYNPPGVCGALKLSQSGARIGTRTVTRLLESLSETQQRALRWMQSLIVFGATGQAGSACLAQAVGHKEVRTVFVIARREPTVVNSKIKFIKHSDFATYSQLLVEQCRGATGIIWCLGSSVSSLGTSESDYRNLTFDYALAAARAFAALDRLNFVYLSCQSAAWSRAQKMTGRVKGDTERELAHFAGVKAVSLRAGNLSAPKVKSSPTRGLIRRISSGIGKTATIDVAEVAAVMVDIALNGAKPGKGGREEEGVYSNADIKDAAVRLGVEI